MSLTGFPSPGKAKLRLRSSPIEGHYIKYRLGLVGFRLSELPDALSVQKSIVYDVISGRRRSARVEAEIARLLGKPSWNDVVSEARAATREFAPAVSRSPARTKRRAS